MEDIKWIAARSLVTPQRFDLMAKMFYVACKDRGLEMSFAKKFYQATIEAFTEGVYIEQGNDTKNSIEAYFRTFDELIESIKNNGIQAEKSLVPVSKLGTIQNGAHRVAIAAYYDLMVPCVICDDGYEPIFNYVYFQNKFLGSCYCDFSAIRYMETTTKEVSALILWPAIFEKKDKSKELIRCIDEQLGKLIIYSKKVRMSLKGLRNLLIQIKIFESGQSLTDGYLQAIQDMADACYSNSKELLVYAIECCSDNLIHKKKEFIDNLGIPDGFLHVTSTSSDAIDLANIIFNDNSVHLLNNGNLVYDRQMYIRAKKFKELVGNDLNNYIIASSAVLGLYGIHNNNEFNYISLSDDSNLVMFDSNEKNIRYFGLSKEQLLLNPQNYLFAFGIKFISLPVLLKYKKNKEEKDCDLVLIGKKIIGCDRTAIMLQQLMISLRRHLRNMKVASKIWLEKHNVYIFTRTWHFIKGKGFR